MKKFYGDKTVFERTQIWAQGLDHWTSLSSVPQFRWTVCSQANTDILYNFTELCIGILDILIQMCMYYPSRLVMKQFLPIIIFFRNEIFVVIICLFSNNKKLLQGRK